MGLSGRRAILDSRTKAPLEMVVIHRLAEVTNHPIVQGAVPNNLIRVCRNEDRRDRVACIDEASVEFDASHSRHLDVGHQAGGFRQERRSQEIRCRRERFDSVAQQRDEFSHGIAKGLVILDDRDQSAFRHRGFRQFLCPTTGAAQCPALQASPYISEGSRQSNGRAPKRWLMPSAIRLGGC